MQLSCRESWTNLRRKQSESDESDEDTAEDAKKSPALVQSDLFAVAKHLRGKMKEKEKESRSENDSLEIT